MSRRVDRSKLMLSGRVLRITNFSEPKIVGSSNIIGALYLALDLEEAGHNHDDIGIDTCVHDNQCRPAYLILVSDDHPENRFHMQLLDCADFVGISCRLETFPDRSEGLIGFWFRHNELDFYRHTDA